MKNRLAAWLVVAIVPLLASCTTAKDSAVLGPVGPQPVTADVLTPQGYLKVFTATEDHNDGDTHYFPHTSYTIYSDDGKTVVKKVPNAIGVHDEDPSLVQLSAGTYVVRAKAENSGMVKIAVIIKPGQLTKVNLEHDGKYRIPPGNTADLVRLPNGQVVGWRATAAAGQSP